MCIWAIIVLLEWVGVDGNLGPQGGLGNANANQNDYDFAGHSRVLESRSPI